MTAHKKTKKEYNAEHACNALGLSKYHKIWIKKKFSERKNSLNAWKDLLKKEGIQF